jgi:predicted nucleic acid-binding protein
MKPDSSASKLLFKQNLDLLAPSFIKEEFSKYKTLCITKSGLDEQLFNERHKIVLSKILFFELDSYREFLPDAIKLISDKNDLPYLALGLKFKADIWSNDRHFKEQSKLRVLSTEELVKVFG